MSALTERDQNLASTPPTATKKTQSAVGEENNMQESQEVQQHRQVLEQKIAENNAKLGQNYISPSDAILSPASQKLSNLKQRQMDKQSGKNPLARSLFGRTASSCSSNPTDETETADDKQ